MIVALPGLFSYLFFLLMINFRNFKSGTYWNQSNDKEPNINEPPHRAVSPEPMLFAHVSGSSRGNFKELDMGS